MSKHKKLISYVFKKSFGRISYIAQPLEFEHMLSYVTLGHPFGTELR